MNNSDRPEFHVWRAMVYRCTDPSCHAWKNYGGRGIRVCDRWLGPDGFDNFFSDMGPRPEGKSESGRALYSIDRHPDNDGDYTPDNCRWATPSEQNRNQRGSLSFEAIAAIRELADLGVGRAALAKTFGVRLERVYRIASNDKLLAALAADRNR